MASPILAASECVAPGQERVFECDVAVVGTGAGGAVAGALLAEAGLHVLFLEEGSYTPTEQLSPALSVALPRLYRDGGVSALVGTPPIPFVEGRCVGGSTLINGGMMWRPPVHVLEEWARLTGSPALGPEGMEALFLEVEDVVSARHHHPLAMGDENRLMLEGPRRQGWHVDINKRNQSLCVGTNHCVTGCPTGAKQSTLVTYVPRAIAAGARCLTETRVEALRIDSGRCVGVEARGYDPRTRKLDRRILVRSRAVVVAGGAVQTPYLLLKHGLGRPSGRLGKNLTVHPNAKVLPIYPFPIKGWQGVNQYAQIRHFHDEGILMADNMIGPAMVASHLPAHGRAAHALMERYDHMILTGVLVEDSVTGQVSRGPFGMAIARYDISEQDHARFKKGVRLLATMHFDLGATEILVPYAHTPIVRSMDELRAAEARQTKRSTLELFTVHLMGTAGMGSNARSSVTSLEGEVWDLPGCYVADASLFPTAIGVNPQLGIMALSSRVARGLASRLNRS